MAMLSQRHTEPADYHPDSITDTQPVAGDALCNAALNTHADSGPSGTDTDGWRHTSFWNVCRRIG